MIAVERNAAGIDDAYLRGLATCFPGAWNEASYRWYLERPFRSRRPDKLTVHDGKSVVAGMGINYRRVRSTAGRVHDIGILTAGWTLPTNRRRGCYSRMLDSAVEIATRDGCAALVGFVTATSSSAAALRRLGARALPTWYLFLAPADAVRPAHRETAEPASADTDVVFHYDDPEEWQAQFVRRPEPTTLLDVDAGIAVVEHAGTWDRLQFLPRRPDSDAAALVTLATHSRHAGRHWFFFTTDARLAERATAHGLRQTAGALLILDLEPKGSLASSSWHVQPGDRM